VVRFLTPGKPLSLYSEWLAFGGDHFYIPISKEPSAWKAKTMFKIVLAQIPDEGTSLVYEKEARIFPVLKEMIESGEVAFEAPLRFELKVRYERDIIRVDVRMTAAIILECSRCLESFKSRIEQPFTLRYARQPIRDVRLEGSTESELASDQIGLSFFEGEEIDLRDALQEQVILALPVKPLCREECQGLCPNCGVDLNRESCQCRMHLRGGPFEKLKSLKLRSDKGS
jgi:uncharacterized protein